MATETTTWAQIGSQRLADGGPRYTETNLSAFIAEPWNAASAGLFIVIVVYWLVRLWGRFTHYPFLTACLPILLAGGIGGTLYHALRTSRVFFLMDVIPISLLCLAVSIYLCLRLKLKFSYVLAIGVLVAGLLALRGWVFRQMAPFLAINLNYGVLALLMMMPVVLVLVRTQFRHAGWVASALSFFIIAWVCRLIDYIRPPVIPMGTHWLWHTFGALATYCISEYLYLIEGRSLSLEPSSGKDLLGDEQGG